MAAQARKRTKRSKKNTAEAAAQGTTIRFESPSSDRKPKPSTAVIVAQEINPVSGFVGFLREYAVITVAIGFAIATQAQGLVRQLTTSFIDPLYALLFNGGTLSTKTTVLAWHGREQAFAWGAFVYSLLNFIFMLVIIYVVVKFFALDKLAKKDDKK
jgi:large-conductance mechanosensitive channel